MKPLKKYSLNVSNWVDTEIQINEGQSKYVYDMVDIWRKGTDAYLELRLRNKNASLKAQKAMQKAIEYDLVRIAYPLAIELMKYHTYRGEEAETEKFQQTVKALQAINDAETIAEYNMIEIDKKIVNKLSIEFILDELDRYIFEVDKLIYDFDSIDFLLSAYKLKIRKAQFLNDSKILFSLCEEAMERFKNKPYDLPHIVFVHFMQPLIPFLIQSRDFEEANQIIQTLKKKLKDKTVNWYVIHSYEVIMNFRKLDFEAAGKLIDEARKTDNKILFERYRIYDAYCSLFSNRHFKLGKFTNEVFEHNKDREGYRINIIIVRLLHLLKYKRYDTYIDRVNAIEHYMYKYLKSTSKRILRSRYFLKSLLMIPKCNFNKVAFKRKTAPLYEKLIATPGNSQNQLLEQEPITYEQLYFFVEGLLK